MPKITIIVPVYNVARYLSKCLDSIIAQTFQDFELILISDGPEKDDKICKEYAKKYNRITLIKGVQNGLGGARNAGLDIAKGEYIVFVDSDDWIEPEYLAKMYNAITPDIDIVQCGTNIIFEGKENKKLKYQDEKYFTINYNGQIPLTNDVYGNINVAVWNKLYKKEIIQKYKIRFPENLNNEDAYFNWAYWSVCKNMYCIQDKLYNYLRRENSLMAQTFNGEIGKNVLDHMKIGELFYNFLQANALFKQREEAFFTTYYIFWLYVQNNGSEKYKKIGHEMARKFLNDKNIPVSQDILIKIIQTPYEKFWSKNSILENIFSIKNSPNIANPHKIITICGIKIKLKKRTNKIIIVDENGVEHNLCSKARIKGLKIKISGTNNTIKIHRPYKFSNCFFDIDSKNAFFEILPNTSWGISNFYVRCKYGENQVLKIGKNTTIAGGICNLDENSQLLIEDDCMLDGYIKIFPSDGHSIIDISNTTKTNGCMMLNEIKTPILIQSNCWIGAGTILLKNAQIPRGSIVGAGSVVTKKFTEENSLLAGNPAKIIRRNVKWDRLSPFYLKKQKGNINA